MNPDAFDSYPEMLNAEQLAKMLGISRAGAYQLLNCDSFLHSISASVKSRRKARCWSGSTR